jgi:hypothetical protein
MVHFRQSHHAGNGRALFLGLLAAASLLTTSAVTTAAAADTVEGPKIELSYEFFGAGFLLGTLETTAIISDIAYDISTRAATAGLADGIANAELQSNAVGRLTANGPLPTSFRTASESNWGSRALQMIRTEEGSFNVAAEPELEPQQAAALRSGLATGTVDPLTASLYSSLRPAAQACSQRVKVFDGRRVFALDFKRTGAETLPVSNQAAFAGETITCNLRYVPLAGQSREWKLQEAKDPSPPIKLWMASFKTADLRQEFLIPVRLQLRTPFGSALVHLQQARISGQPMMQAGLLPPDGQGIDLATDRVGRP